MGTLTFNVINSKTGAKTAFQVLGAAAQNRVLGLINDSNHSIIVKRSLGSDIKVDEKSYDSVCKALTTLQQKGQLNNKEDALYKVIDDADFDAVNSTEVQCNSAHVAKNIWHQDNMDSNGVSLDYHTGQKVSIFIAEKGEI